MNTVEKEIPKHRKKKESTTSKSNKKAKHKHEYIECLVIDKKYNHPHRASYCKICGKIYNISFFESEKNESGYYRVLKKEEILEKYKHLEVFYINDTFDKYIPIVNVEENIED